MVLFPKAEREGSLKGFSLSKRSPSLTYILFTDDSLLFL